MENKKKESLETVALIVIPVLLIAFVCVVGNVLGIEEFQRMFQRI